MRWRRNTLEVRRVKRQKTAKRKQCVKMLQVKGDHELVVFHEAAIVKERPRCVKSPSHHHEGTVKLFECCSLCSHPIYAFP